MNVTSLRAGYERCGDELWGVTEGALWHTSGRSILTEHPSKKCCPPACKGSECYDSHESYHAGAALRVLQLLFWRNDHALNRHTNAIPMCIRQWSQSSRQSRA